MSLIFIEREWDYIVKELKDGSWVAKNSRGNTLNTAASSTSLEDLVNACVSDQGSNPATIQLSPLLGSTMNIDGTILLNEDTVLRGYGPNRVTRIYLEDGSDCDMVAPSADNNDNILIKDLELDGNCDNNAGDIDCISWEMGATVSSSWKMLMLINVRAYYADRNNIRVTSTSGDYATVWMQNIKSFYADEDAIYWKRVFDSGMNDIECTNMYINEGSASNRYENIYISGGTDHGIRINDLGTGSWGPHKSMWNNIRIDNVQPGSDTDDAALYMNDVYWNVFTGLSITNLNSNATDKARKAIYLTGASTENVFSGVSFVRDTEYTTKYWRYGVYEDNTSGENLYSGINFGDAVSTDADDYELGLNSGYGSLALNCIRSGGKTARRRYI